MLNYAKFPLHLHFGFCLLNSRAHQINEPCNAFKLDKKNVGRMMGTGGMGPQFPLDLPWDESCILTGRGSHAKDHKQLAFEVPGAGF